MEVLHERFAQQIVVGRAAHDRRDMSQSSALAGPPPPLAHDKLEMAGHHGADNHRLKQADLPDGGGKLLQAFLVKVLPGLARVGGDRPNGHFLEIGVSRSSHLLRGCRRSQCREIPGTRACASLPHGCGCGGYERPKSLAESPLLLSHLISSRYPAPAAKPVTVVRRPCSPAPARQKQPPPAPSRASHLHCPSVFPAHLPKRPARATQRGHTHAAVADRPPAATYLGHHHRWRTRDQRRQRIAMGTGGSATQRDGFRQTDSRIRRGRHPPANAVTGGTADLTGTGGSPRRRDVVCRPRLRSQSWRHPPTDAVTGGGNGRYGCGRIAVVAPPSGADAA